MKEKEIIEGNILIEKFYKSTGQHTTSVIMPNKMEYHSSWDWLMPVVEKCYSNDDDYMDTLCAKFDFFYIEPMYNAVVKYIKWYNENNQS